MKKSLAREIHYIQLFTLLIFGIIFFIMTVLTFWDRTVEFQKEQLLTLNRLLVTELTEQKILAQTVFYQNNGKTEELRRLLGPVIQKILQSFTKNYVAGYYSTSQDQIIIARSHSDVSRITGSRLAKDDPGRKIWITKHYLFTNQWSRQTKTWVLKCYYPVMLNNEVIGHTFATVNLWGIGPLLKDRLLNFLIMIFGGLLVSLLFGIKATRKIKKNIHRLTLVEPHKKFPPFDYTEFNKVAETNHKVFEDLIITEKAKTELLTNFPWGFCIINGNGVLININNKGLDLLGLKREAVLHRGISVLGREFTAVLRAFHEKKPIETEVILPSADGDKKVLMVNAFPVTLNSEESGAMACFIDITGQRRMQLMLEHMNRQSTVGEMISVIVHDIRNPLAVIKALSQLSYMKPESNYRLNCKKIDKLADDINSYLGKILTFAQPVNETLNYCSVKEMFENVLILLQAKLNAAQLIVESWIAAPEPFVYVNQLDFQYALYTLLNNASEASKGPGKIGFQVDYYNEMVRIVITDSSKGLAEQELSQIWDTNISGKLKGINIGMSMSKRLIEKFNGDILVTSEVGKGTAFTILLPAASGKPDQSLSS
ncbi:MAG TPA: ATP-binding protein [Bacillota bacterium]